MRLESGNIAHLTLGLLRKAWATPQRLQSLTSEALEALQLSLTSLLRVLSTRPQDVRTHKDYHQPSELRSTATASLLQSGRQTEQLISQPTLTLVGSLSAHYRHWLIHSNLIAQVAELARQRVAYSSEHGLTIKAKQLPQL
jgi:hypothetical protein